MMRCKLGEAQWIRLMVNDMIRYWLNLTLCLRNMIPNYFEKHIVDKVSPKFKEMIHNYIIKNHLILILYLKNIILN